MSNKFIARQAILDRNKNTFAYELLYRNSFDNFYSCSDEEKATSQIIFQNHIFGDLTAICSQKKAFINFDEKSLLENIPLFLDKSAVIIELLETINVTAELIKSVSLLHDKGYVLALDDYDFSGKWEALFPYIAIIKVDIDDFPIDDIAKLKRSDLVAQNNIKIVVERVENHEQFEALYAIGIDYFQGYFFHKPEMNSGYFIEPIKLNLLLLFTEVCQPSVDFTSIAKIISQDVSLINGTLRLVNLKAEQNRVEITSIKQAVTFLGIEKIKQFVAIIAMSKLSSDSTAELLTQSLMRGKMMEYISAYPAFYAIKEFAFITGIMSHIDAILHCPLEQIIIELPLSKQIKAALINNQGLLYEALALAKYFESIDDQQDIKVIMHKHDISEDMLINNYHETLSWCNYISS